MSNPEIRVESWQLEYLRGLKNGPLIEAWMREHMTVIDVKSDKTLQEIQSRINEELRNLYLDRLGSLAHEQQIGMAKDSKVSKLRGLSYGPHSVVFDEANRITEIDSGHAYWRRIPESDAVQLTNWLQHRSVCRRTLSCSIP